MTTWEPGAEADVRIINAADGVIEVVPPRKRVAIVGFAWSSLHMVPWDEPSVECWGLNQGYQHFKRRPDRWFEIHRPENREDVAVPTYLADLAALPCPVYMIHPEPTIPTSVAYPLSRVQRHFPPVYQNYFTSCVAYMIALAIVEGMEWIGLYGVDCSIGTEYERQKPCIEAWCSLAMGRGLTVYIPPTSALFKGAFLYGYEPPREYPRILQASEAFLRGRIAEYKKQSNDLLANLHRQEGAINELDGLLKFAEAKSRGASFPTIDGTLPP